MGTTAGGGAQLLSCLLMLDARLCAGYSTLQRLPEDRQPKYRSFLSNVHGVLYQVNKDDMRKLQKREGGYVLTEIEVRSNSCRLPGRGCTCCC